MYIHVYYMYVHVVTVYMYLVLREVVGGYIRLGRKGWAGHGTKFRHNEDVPTNNSAQS